MTHPVVMVLAFIGAAGCFTFMLLYQTLAHWWRTAAGRHIMMSMVALFAALMLVAAETLRWTDHFGVTWRRTVETVVISAILLLIAWRIAVLLKSQLSRQRKE